jgi:hypothetical protein
MAGVFWFNRMVEYWSIPLHLDLADLVRRGGIQLVQAGTFGPQFYSLADDPDADRRWVGMPLAGVRENLALAKDLIPRIQEAGAKFVGQMSMSWHYGDHEHGKGLFGAWDRIWTDDLLGPAPCPDPGMAQEQVAGGSIRTWPIEGRPYRTYCGCISNPYWVATLKPMVKKAIDLGVDGLMVHHNFSTFCACSYCREYLRPRLQERFDAADLRAVFGAGDLADVQDLTAAHTGCPDALKSRFERYVQQLVHLRRKEVFDDIYIAYGRRLKPDLMLSQWYHKYDFKASDERSLLPGGLWARDEDYIWYSQGGSKGFSLLRQGYLADMGLPARFTYAAGGGRPFVINKYDYRRLRLSIAEAGANHAAAPAYHWTPEAEAFRDPAEYTGPLVRYHRFLADHHDLIHPARPWSQVALVYARRAEVAAEGEALAPLRRLGRLMEDAHVLFEIILDEQILERLHHFDMVILPNAGRLSPEESAGIRQFVETGGRLVLVGASGVMTPEGQPYETSQFSAWEIPTATPGDSTVTSWGRGFVLYIPDGPWHSETREIRPGLNVRAYHLHIDDAFGQTFIKHLKALCGAWRLKTDAPWFVRIRAWRPERQEALALHWVNYQQDEDAVIEVPMPVGPIQAEVAVPAGYAVDRVEWRYPEMREPAVLPHEASETGVRFTIPNLIVYGLSILHLRKG